MRLHRAPLLHLGLGEGDRHPPRAAALALALQCGRPVHECFYAACAEAAFAPLVSSDETFLQALRCEGIAVRGVPLSRVHELEQ